MKRKLIKTHFGNRNFRWDEVSKLDIITLNYYTKYCNPSGFKEVKEQDKDKWRNINATVTSYSYDLKEYYDSQSQTWILL